jgi:hypothetical protein
MFTLKVIEGDFIKPDTRHPNGGVDFKQELAFRHLFPSGECPWIWRECLFALAEMHGWEVSVSKSTKG